MAVLIRDWIRYHRQHPDFPVTLGSVIDSLGRGILIFDVYFLGSVSWH